jgi:hypothetical protein
MFLVPDIETMFDTPGLQQCYWSRETGWSNHLQVGAEISRSGVHQKILRTFWVAGPGIATGQRPRLGQIPAREFREQDEAWQASLATALPSGSACLGELDY